MPRVISFKWQIHTRLSHTEESKMVSTKQETVSYYHIRDKFQRSFGVNYLSKALEQ